MATPLIAAIDTSSGAFLIVAIIGTIAFATSGVMAAAEAGIPCVSHRAADDLVRDAETFLARVCDVLELAYQPSLESRLRAVG